jgi:hypothetical protein
MPLRIADYVFSGELRNTRRNSVFGWIEFAPDYGIRLELTGNFSAELGSKHIRFKNVNLDPQRICEPGSFPTYIEELEDRQIGVVQSMELRTTKVPNLPIDEFLSLPEIERESHLTEKASLWLEWSGQNGDLLCELIQPEIEYVEEEPSSNSTLHAGRPHSFGAGLESGATELILNEDDPTFGEYNPEDDEVDGELGPADDFDEEEGEDEEDPYGLFDENLQQSVNASLGDELPQLDHGAKREWDDVIPDIDPETKAMYEQWDEIFEGKKDEPLSYLFPTTLKLPKPEHVDSEEEAEKLVKAILAQLALLSVAIDVCEHFSAQQTYRLLMQEILPSAKVHPNLAASEMVQHYATSDYCQQCDAEFEAEYEARKRAQAESEPADAEQPGEDDPEASEG